MHDPSAGIKILCQDRKHLTVLALRLTFVFTYLCAEGPSTSNVVFHASNFFEHVPHVNSEAVAPYETQDNDPRFSYPPIAGNRSYSTEAE